MGKHTKKYANQYYNMKTLYIDTHLFDIRLILFKDNEVYKKEEVLNQKHNSEFLMPSVEKLLDGEDFDQIIVINGPGSFTGVRLGVTIAKTLAFTMNKPIKTITYFDVMNTSLESSNHILGISDGNGYFIAEYQNKKLAKDLYYLNNPDYVKFSEDKEIITDVSIDMRKVLEYAENIESTPAHAVNPIYIKLIGVEYDKKN